jgi:methylphosphotriester-DNA--protein-cysteine methyltransferase
MSGYREFRPAGHVRAVVACVWEQRPTVDHTLARVARLRRLIALEDQDLAARALAAGYASQAHMNDDVRRLTGTTPVRFLEDAQLTAA